MQRVRVMLELRMPERRDIPRDEAIADAELLDTLRQAKERILNG